MEYLSTNCYRGWGGDTSALVFMEFLEVDKRLNKNWDCEEGWEEEVQTTTKLMTEGLTSFGKYEESGGIRADS